MPEHGVTEPPVDLGPLEGAARRGLAYFRSREDHLVDFTRAGTPSYLHGLAYAQVTVPAAQAAHLVLTTHGPAEVWVNGSTSSASSTWSPAPAQRHRAV